MNSKLQYLVPTVIEKTTYGERVYDIFSRLLKDRIIFVGGPINETIANTIIAQLLFLESQDSKKDIYLYINSPGGTVTGTLAIYDTMQYLQCDVSTICVGIAASGAALLLAGGTKGKRMALPNCDVMIHQVMGGAEGAAADIAIVARHIVKLRDRINEILARHTSQSIEKIAKDTDRDFFMSAQEAKDYGLIDKIITKGDKEKNKK